MGLVRIFTPRTESEAAVVVALLEAHEIPVYLHNHHLASVLPGVLINAYNGQSVMVAEEHADAALELTINFRVAPSPVADGSWLRNLLEGLFLGWFVPSQELQQRRGVKLARFVTFHDVGESERSSVGELRFAIMLARSANGVVLVLNRFRKVWELPGGLIDPGELPAEAAARELREEAGCIAEDVAWCGIIEVQDGRTHLGAVYQCRVGSVPDGFISEETGGVALWRRDCAPRPLGESDAAVLNRFA
jgi:8-oxo-dGTP diphosphatase